MKADQSQDLEQLKRRIFRLHINVFDQKILGQNVYGEKDVYITCNNLADAVNWYKEAYPNYEILSVSSLEFKTIVLRETKDN